MLNPPAFRKQLFNKTVSAARIGGGGRVGEEKGGGGSLVPRPKTASDNTYVHLGLGTRLRL